MWRHNPNQSSLIFNWTLRNKVQWNFNQKTKRFFRENTFENVTCKMAAILLQSQAEGNEEQYHYGARGAFQKAYELLNLRALKISMLYKNHIFQCTGKIFCVEVTCEIPHKISCPYIERALMSYLLHCIYPNQKIDRVVGQHLTRPCGEGLDTLRPGQYGHTLADDIIKCWLVNENVFISI